MSDKFWEFYACQRKKGAWHEQKDADKKAAEIYKRDGTRMYSYKCPYCHRYHLTKKKQMKH